MNHLESWGRQPTAKQIVRQIGWSSDSLPAPLPGESFLPYGLGFLACVVICLALSTQSLWIDEGDTALKAIPPTLHGWWHALDSEHKSNMQLPLYMLYIWAWARLFGVSELALRAGNIPWFVLGLTAIFHFLRRHPALRNATLLLYCLHPFVWYYLDEARPYLMQLSGSLLVTGCFLDAIEEDQAPFSASWWWFFASGTAILCGAGLLGVPWAVAFLIPLLFHPGFRKSMSRSGRIAGRPAECHRFVSGHWRRSREFSCEPLMSCLDAR